MDVGNKQVDRRKRKNPAVGWVLKFGAGTGLIWQAPCGRRPIATLWVAFNKKADSFLNRLFKIWSGKRDSNSRPRPWQGRALPTELFPQQKRYFV